MRTSETHDRTRHSAPQIRRVADDVSARLRGIEDTLAVMRVEQARQAAEQAQLAAKIDLLLLRKRELSRIDLDHLAQLLPVTAAVFGSELFMSKELRASRAPGLVLICRELQLSTKQVGRLFSACGRATDQRVRDRARGSLKTRKKRILTRRD